MEKWTAKQWVDNIIQHMKAVEKYRKELTEMSNEEREILSFARDHQKFWKKY
jgi:hypothetical protein